MRLHSRTPQTTILATGSAFALLMAALGDHAHGEGNAFKRMDRVTAEKGYAGPVVVCSVSYEPIAGHRANIPLVKYLSEGRESRSRSRRSLVRAYWHHFGYWL